jgi:hypothetical protein
MVDDDRGGEVAPANDCVEGYVWRGATDTDHVCVVPQTRDDTAADSRRRVATS